MRREQYTVLFTTNPGIEDIAADEIRARLRASIEEVRENHGRVIAKVREEYLDLIEELRSIYRARIVLRRGRICAEMICLRDLAQIVNDSGVHEYLSPDSSFAIRVNRAGLHEFNSMDIARVAGDAVIEAAVKYRGFRPRVDLDYPSIIISVDVIDSDVIVSLELSGDLSWHRRGYRIYDHPAALKPTLAYAMLILSSISDRDSLLDPMCGGGTIVIEAAYMLENSRLYCLDKNPRHINGAKLNAMAALVQNRISFFVGDATKLSRYIREVDVIVSNPPYGIRLGSPRQVRRVYSEFIKEAVSITNKSIVLITPDYDFVKKSLLDNGWRIFHERVVAHGNLYPHILVAKP